MDPVSLIVAALVAGAARSADGVADQSLKDAYAGLKSLVKRFFQGKPAAEMVLEEHEKDPTAYEVPLKKALQESGAAQYVQVLEDARRLLAMVDPDGTRAGRYNIVSVKADRGGVAIGGDHQGNIQAGYHPAPGNTPDPS